MANQTDATYQSSSTTDTARSIATTLRKNLRMREPAMLRSRKLTALVERDGGVVSNVSGAGIEWNVQDRIHSIHPNDGTNRREFAAQNLYRVANLQFGGFDVQDAISRGELVANRGREAVIRVADTMVARLEESFMEHLALRFYESGDDTSFKVYGIESFMDVRTTANVDQAFDWGTASTVPSNTVENNSYENPIMVPDDVYAGLQTSLGYYGGAQESGGWPQGVCSPQFDFWAPLVLNTNSTFFGSITSATGWQDNAPDVVRFGLTHAGRNAAKNQLNLVLMDRTLYLQFKNQMLASSERVNITSETGLRAFGFKDVFDFDGVEISHEYGIPTTTVNRAAAADVTSLSAYGFSTKNIEILSRFGGISEPMPANGEYDKETQAYAYCLEALLQLKFASPRNFVKWSAYSAKS